MTQARQKSNSPICISGQRFRLDKILIHFSQFEITNRSSSSINLSIYQLVTRKKACVKIKNYNDGACFLWSITSALYPANVSSDCTSSYPHYTTVLNISDLESPMPLSQIKNLIFRLMSIFQRSYVSLKRYLLFVRRV